MDNNNTVIVTSMIDSTISLLLPEYHFQRTWPKVGAKFPIDKDMLRASFYDTGVSNLFKAGYLWIEDSELRKEFGLEVAEDDETSNIGVVKADEELFKKIAETMTAKEAKKAIGKLTTPQKEELVRYGVRNYESLKMDRINLISDLCNSNIMKIVDIGKSAED